MARLSYVVVLLCNDAARAAGPGSSSGSGLPRGSRESPPRDETPYPSGSDAYPFGPPMGGAAGFLGAFDRPSYAGLPWDTEPNANTPGTSTSTGPLDFLANSPEVPPHAPVLWAGPTDSFAAAVRPGRAPAARAASPPGFPTTPRREDEPVRTPRTPVGPRQPQRAPESPATPAGAGGAYNPSTPPRSHVPGPRKLRLDPEQRTEDDYHDTLRREEEAREAADLERARQTIVDELNQETADDETPLYQSDRFARENHRFVQKKKSASMKSTEKKECSIMVEVRSMSAGTLTVPAEALLRDVLRDPLFTQYKEQKGALCFTLADNPRSTEKWLVQSGLRSGEETMGEIVEQLNKGPGGEVAATVCDRTATGEEALNAPAKLHLQAVMLQMPKRVRVYFPMPPFPDNLHFPGALAPQHMAQYFDPFMVEHHLNHAVAKGLLDLDGVWQREFPSLLTVDDLVTRIRDHYKRYYIERYTVEDTGPSWALPALATRALQIELPSLYLERVAADRAPANGEQEPAAQPPANGLARDRLVREAKLQRLARDRLARSQEQIDVGKRNGNLFPLVENDLKDTVTARQGLWEVCAQLPGPAEDDGSECTLRVVAPEAPRAGLPVPWAAAHLLGAANQRPAPDAA